MHSAPEADSASPQGSGSPAETPRSSGFLARLWGSRDRSAPREKPPEDVAHDIYRVPDHQTPIPPRAPPRRHHRRRSA